MTDGSPYSFSRWWPAILSKPYNRSTTTRSLCSTVRLRSSGRANSWQPWLVGNPWKPMKLTSLILVFYQSLIITPSILCFSSATFQHFSQSAECWCVLLWLLIQLFRSPVLRTRSYVLRMFLFSSVNSLSSTSVNRHSRNFFT